MEGNHVSVTVCMGLCYILERCRREMLAWVGVVSGIEDERWPPLTCATRLPLGGNSDAVVDVVWQQCGVEEPADVLDARHLQPDGTVELGALAFERPPRPPLQLCIVIHAQHVTVTAMHTAASAVSLRRDRRCASTCTFCDNDASKHQNGNTIEIQRLSIA